MQKNQTIVISIMLFFLLIPSPIYAAGSAAESDPVKIETIYGKTVIVPFECTGDAADGSVPDTAFSDASMGKILGLYLYEVETIPGAGGDQPDAYIPKIVNSRGTELFSPSARSTTVNELAYPSGGFPKIDDDLTFTVSGIGNSNKTTILFKFVE